MFMHKKLTAAELRRQAEAKLSERKRQAPALSVTESDIQRLVHELEVHQIELEMQNEELVQSRVQVEAGLRQYTDLYDFAPIGYFTLACDGAILQVNLAGADLLGVERGAMIKRRFGVFVSVELRSVFSTFLETVFESKQKERCEVALQKDGAAPLWVHIEAISEDGQKCRVVVVDFTERKHAEELQNETERVKSGLLEKLNRSEEHTSELQSP
jgi:PAS domain S-box-containing protein